MVSKNTIAAILGLGALGLTVLVVAKALVKPARQAYTEPAQASPGETFVLNVKGFTPPVLTIIVQGYGALPDSIYVRSLRADGSGEYTFTVEPDRPAGKYYLNIFDSEGGITIWFTVL